VSAASGIADLPLLASAAHLPAPHARRYSRRRTATTGTPPTLPRNRSSSQHSAPGGACSRLWW
jgi:hypothetical protein